MARSQVLINIDQSCVEFTIPKDLKKSTSDSSLFIKNESNNFVAVRIKTTKKEMYAVNPTYLVMKPKEGVDIKVVYMRKDTDEPTDISKHKFKIEAVVSETENMQLEEIKQYFEDLISSGKKIKGNSIKKRVYHKVEDAAGNSEISKVQAAKAAVKRESKPEIPLKESEEEPLK